jgi:hypothetical protein
MEVSGSAPRTRILTVSSSSKKAGKSTLASRLVKELGADYGMKVSSGESHRTASPIITDEKIIGRPGTDTGALVEAGAGAVVWVNAPTDKLGRELRRALDMFPPGGIMVLEGNSALGYLDPEFSIFLMNVPFEDFKQSAGAALSRADLVLVDMRGPLAGTDGNSLLGEIKERAPGAAVRFYRDDGEMRQALDAAVLAAGRRLGLNAGK